MVCPKPKITYPVTARYFELPYDALVRKVEPDFDKARRFDLAYDFGARRKLFFEDSLSHGAYVDMGSNLNTNPALTSGPQDGPTWAGAIDPTTGQSELSQVLAEIELSQRGQNGACDPISNYGNITTGTGAGGRDPGDVPSIDPILAEDGTVVLDEDGNPVLSGYYDGVGVVIGPSS